MIAQYPWASVKVQERKYIEIGIMVTLLLGICSFYFVPTFGSEVVLEEVLVPPPLDVVTIPATIQPPEITKPTAPSIPVSVEDDPEMDDEMLWADTYTEGAIGLLVPPEPPSITIPLWAVETMPAPIGGYAAIQRAAIYPTIAREAGIEGTVTIQATIGKDGLVKEMIVLKGVPNTGLDEAAMAAIKATLWTPAYQRDKAVTVQISVPVVFRLKKI
jgi:protein TonB